MKKFTQGTLAVALAAAILCVAPMGALASASDNTTTETGSTETGSTETGSTETGSTETGSTETGSTASTASGNTTSSESSSSTESEAAPQQVVQAQPQVVEVVEVIEPTAETIANPAMSATYQQAMASAVANVEQVAKQISLGRISADTVATVNLGNFHSVSAKAMNELANAKVDVRLTYRYMGHTFTVRIPRGYQPDRAIAWFGPLYMYAHFGESVE